MIKNSNHLALTTLALFIFAGCVAKDTGPDENAINNYVDSNKRVQCLGKQCVNSDKPKSIREHKPKNDYETERDKALAQIIKTPPTPLRVPDTVIRVLVLPYVDDEQTLTAQAYKFVKVDNGKWMLGEYLRNDGNSIGLLTPLQNAIPSKQDNIATPAPVETVEKPSMVENIQQLQQKTNEEIK